MKISTRGRYALRVMIDLAENQGDGVIPMKEVALRQGISLKYLEQILPILSKNNYIEATHGKGGGYRLTAPPETYRVGQILRLTEGDLAPVACLQQDAQACQRQQECRTFVLWSNLNSLINSYLDGVTLADLMRKES